MPKADFKSAAFTNFATPARVQSPIGTTVPAQYADWPYLERFGNEREIPHRGGIASPEIVPKDVLGGFPEHCLREAGRSPIIATDHAIPGAHNAHSGAFSHANRGE